MLTSEYLVLVLLDPFLSWTESPGVGDRGSVRPYVAPGLGRGYWAWGLPSEISSASLYDLLNMKRDATNDLAKRFVQQGDSTRDTFQNWLEAQSSTELGTTRNILPLLFALRIMHRDAAQTLHTVHKELVGIKADMNKESIHKRWSQWQKLFVRFLQLEKSIRVNINACLAAIEVLASDSGSDTSWSFCKTTKAGNTTWAKGLHSPKQQSEGPSLGQLQGLYRDLAELLPDLDAIRAEVIETSNSLTSTMSIIESERAISEAGSVSRLAELAFLFVPLSISGSIFGMQMKVSGSTLSFLLHVILGSPTGRWNPDTTTGQFSDRGVNLAIFFPRRARYHHYLGIQSACYSRRLILAAVLHHQSSRQTCLQRGFLLDPEE